MWGTTHASNALQQDIHNKQTCWTAYVLIIPFTHTHCHHKTGADKNTKGPSVKWALYGKGRMSQVSGVSLRAHLPCAGVWPYLCYRPGLWQDFMTSWLPQLQRQTEANQLSLTHMAQLHCTNAVLYRRASAPVKTNMPGTHDRRVKPKENSVKLHNQFFYETFKPAHQIRPLYCSQMLSSTCSWCSVCCGVYQVTVSETRTIRIVHKC